MFSGPSVYPSIHSFIHPLTPLFSTKHFLCPRLCARL